MHDASRFAQQAADLRRSHPLAPALDVLAPAFQGMAPGSASFPDPMAPDDSLTGPRSPFGQIVAAAFDLGLAPEDCVSLTGPTADPRMPSLAFWGRWVRRDSMREPPCVMTRSRRRRATPAAPQASATRPHLTVQPSSGGPLMLDPQVRAPTDPTEARQLPLVLRLAELLPVFVPWPARDDPEMTFVPGRAQLTTGR